jgi:hypothetical protein
VRAARPSPALLRSATSPTSWARCTGHWLTLFVSGCGSNRALPSWPDQTKARHWRLPPITYFAVVTRAGGGAGGSGRGVAFGTGSGIPSGTGPNFVRCHCWYAAICRSLGTDVVTAPESLRNSITTRPRLGSNRRVGLAIGSAVAGCADCGVDSYAAVLAASALSLAVRTAVIAWTVRSLDMADWPVMPRRSGARDEVILRPIR